MTHRSLRVARLTLISSALIVAIGPEAWAESACKGLDQTACAARAECRWTNGYIRKDGVQVSGHCRLSAKKKEMAPAADAKPAAPAVTGTPTTAAQNPAPPAATAPATPANPMPAPTGAAPAAKMEPAAPAGAMKTTP